MAITAADVQAWLAANPNATDQDIARVAAQFGVSNDLISQATGVSSRDVANRLWNAGVANARDLVTQINQGAWADADIDRVMREQGIGSAQMAMASGLSADEINRRRAAVSPGQLSGAQLNAGTNGITSADIQGWLAANPNATDADIARAAQQYGVSYEQIANATGVPLDEVRRRVQAVGLPNPGIVGQTQQGMVGNATAPINAAFGNPFAYNQQNPYLDQMGQQVLGQLNENLFRNVLPQINSQAIMAGGFGGSRQGVVQANALRDLNAQGANALTGMRFQDYNNQLARQMQLRGIDQGFTTNLGNLSLGFQNSGQNFYTQQRGQDLQQLGLGASLLGQGTQGLLGQGQGLYGVGQTTQQAPWQVVNNAAGATSPFTGFGNTTTTGGGNNPWGGMLGGALAGAQFGRLFG